MAEGFDCSRCFQRPSSPVQSTDCTSFLLLSNAVNRAYVVCSHYVCVLNEGDMSWGLCTGLYSLEFWQCVYKTLSNHATGQVLHKLLFAAADTVFYCSHVCRHVGFISGCYVNKFFPFNAHILQYSCRLGFLLQMLSKSMQWTHRQQLQTTRNSR